MSLFKDLFGFSLFSSSGKEDSGIKEMKLLTIDKYDDSNQAMVKYEEKEDEEN